MGIQVARKTRGLLGARLLVLLAPTILGLLCNQAYSRNRQFTIDQVFSAPFPSDLVASAARSNLAWVFNLRGSRNIWIAERSPEGIYKARPVTSYLGDNGEDIGELAWDPRGETVVYVEGGDLENGEGLYPNPLSLPEGAPKQRVMAISVSGGEPIRLAEGHSPSVSPREDVVAYLLNGQVWLTRLDGTGKPETLIQEKGSSDSLRWSPDGSQLAFVSHRNDHSIVGVYSFPQKSVVWLAPGVDEDRDPEWSPDGTRVAFVRAPAGDVRFPYRARASRQPWSIWVADPATGKGHQLWSAAEGPGSIFYATGPESDLLWSAGDRIIFPWECTGWLHLYSMPIQGGKPELLTPGNFEVSGAVLSSDRKEVVYSSNQGDLDRRHVWRVPVVGGPPTELTPGRGIESFAIVASDGRTVAMLCSDAQNPLHPCVVTDPGQIRDLALVTVPTDFPRSKFVAPQQILFPTADGITIHAQLFLPLASPSGTRHPAIIFFHGGPERQMLLGWHPVDAYNYMYGMNEYFASEGYVVLSVNYRGGTGYGLAFREPRNFGPAGASEFKDILAAGSYLRGRSDVDSKRIGLWGGSYGGYMTALGLSRASGLFAAGVDYAGVHDWTTILPYLNVPSAPPDQIHTAWHSSPVASIKDWRSPVLIIQGDDDRDVLFSQSVELIKALRKQGVKFEQIAIPDEVHDSLLYATWIRFFERADDFFLHHLRGLQD